MSLMTCKECSKEISANARECPNCGNPMKDATVVVEQTNKKYKGGVLIGWSVALIGIFLIFSGDPNLAEASVFMIVGGILCAIGFKIAAWWQHG